VIRLAVIILMAVAVYEYISQDGSGFFARYPLVDGQGNFGSIDGDSAAANALYRGTPGSNFKRNGLKTLKKKL